MATRSRLLVSGADRFDYRMGGLAGRGCALTSQGAVVSLKATKSFLEVSKRGKWKSTRWLSIGIFPNGTNQTRVGLRTRRGLKPAVVRNRLKRQTRAILSRQERDIRRGFDIVIVIHPPTLPTKSSELERDFISLCKQCGIFQ